MEDFKPMIKMDINKMVEIAIDSAGKAKSLMAYCDYIAHIISGKLQSHDSERLLEIVGRPRLDLNESGSFKSTKKTINVQDVYGKKYRITVEEA